MHDLGEQGLAPHALGPHDEAARPVHGPAGDPAPGRLLRRDRLTCHHRLIDGARALEDHTVDRYPLARPDPESIVRLHLLERDVFLGPVVSYAARRLRRQTKERSDGAARLTPRPQLDHLTQQHERRDDGGGLEIEPDLASVGAE